MENSQKPIVNKWQIVLSMMGDGHLLFHHTPTNAVWLDKFGISSDFKVSHGVRRFLEEKRFIERHSEEHPHAKYQISKLGMREVERIAKGEETITPEGLEYGEKIVVTQFKEDPKPIKILPAKPQAQSEEMAFESEKMSAFVNRLGRGEGYIVVIKVTDALTLSRITGTLGIEAATRPASMGAALKSAKESAPKPMKTCYYCHKAFAVKRMKKSWRNVCSDAYCRTRYHGDFKTHKEMVQAGIEV